MDRKEVIDLLSKKLNGDLKISYDHLAVLTNYSKRQLIRGSLTVSRPTYNTQSTQNTYAV